MINLSSFIKENLYCNLSSFIINESLSSVTADKFIDIFKKKLQITDDDIWFVPNKDVKPELLNTKTFVECIVKNHDKINPKWFNKNVNKINEICKLTNYYLTMNSISNVEYVRNSLTFEPLYPEMVTNNIKENFNGKIYHVTKTSNIDSINKKGILAVGPENKNIDDPILALDIDTLKTNALNNFLSDDSKTTKEKIGKSIVYRNFPNRAFFFYGNKDVLKMAEELFKYLSKSSSIWSKEDYSIVEIDINKHNLTLYKDTLLSPENDFDKKGIYFCYSNIDVPKEMISNIINVSTGEKYNKPKNNKITNKKIKVKKNFR